MRADEDIIATRLTHAGMSPAAAGGKGRLFAQALAALGELRTGEGMSGGLSRFSSDENGTVPLRCASDTYLLFVPGRIEVLGKHTDYGGGRSLLAAVERGFCIAAVPRNDETICIVDASCGSRSSFALGPELTPTAGHWSNYPMTVARRVARNFRGPLRGADIALMSDLPQAAGMSSSSAMITGMFQVLSHLNGLAQRPEYRANIAGPEALAGYLATIENGQSFGSLPGDRGVGTFGGSEDHTAICCCQPGRFHLYAFCPVRPEQVIAVPAGYVLAVGVSGVLAEKTGRAMAQYNQVSRRVSALLELWHAETGRNDRCLADIVHSASDAADHLRRIVADRPHPEFDSVALIERLEQFLTESEQIIPAAAAALSHATMDEFGRLVDQSQHLAEQLLRNQVPQTIRLARAARECGALAASAFGAGFGGSVWALVTAATAEEFLAKWADRYRHEFPANADRCCFFLSGAGPGMIEL